MVKFSQRCAFLASVAVMVSALFWVLPTAVSADSGPGELRAVEELFLELVNTLRQDPSAAIKGYGMDPASIVASKPALAPIFEGGLPLLAVNETLNAAARAHCEDMLERDYYSYLSPEGWSGRDRVVQVGYLPIYWAECLGGVAFYNYMAPQEAASHLFEGMLKAELQGADKIEDLRLLSPYARELGLCIMPGTMTISGNRFNVYVAVCELGQEASEEEMGLVHLINQARAFPLQVAERYGVDPTVVVESHPWLAGLSPLLPHILLSEAAGLHADDMLENQYFSHVSMDGRGPEARIWATGYEGFPVGERIGIRPLCEGIDGGEAAARVFRSWFLNELEAGQAARILDPDFREIGIGAARGYAPDLAGICGDEAALFVADLGVGLSQSSGIMGLFYRDSDGDGLYSLGEGVGGLRVHVSSTQGVVGQGITDKTGWIWLQVQPGDYTLALRDEGGELLMLQEMVVSATPTLVSVDIDMGLTHGGE